VKRVLLVCAADCSELEARLVRGGCFVTRVDNGAEAISRAKHEDLDAAVLVSTGEEMDLAEVALNLSDIKPSLEIILVAQQSGEKDAAQINAVARAIPHVRMFTIQALNDFLGLPSG
jgi:DNA-binding response OmpR family regulator